MTDTPSTIGLSEAQRAVKSLRDCPDTDRGFYLDVIKRRGAALEEDEPIFGLLPEEVAELWYLRAHLLTLQEKK